MWKCADMEMTNSASLVSAETLMNNFDCWYFRILGINHCLNESSLAAFAKPLRALRYKKEFFLNAVSQRTRRTAKNAIGGEK